MVAGLGRAGGAATEALLAHPAAQRVLAWDALTTSPLRGVAARLRRRGAEVQLGGDPLASLDAAGPDATVVKSPGMDLDTPLLERADRRVIS